MSFSLSSVKKFASKLKDSISSNTSASSQSSTSINQTASSLKNSLSEVFSSVKSGSIAVGNKIAQTAENLLSKNTDIISIVINSSQLSYIRDNLGILCSSHLL